MPQRDGGPARPPEEWKSGDEPMTESQASFLKRLTSEAGEPFDATLSKAAASRRIDELLSRGKGSARGTGGGRRAPAPHPERRPPARAGTAGGGPAGLLEGAAPGGGRAVAPPR